MSNSVDPDETAHYEPSHLDLRCLQKAYYYRLWQWKRSSVLLIDTGQLLLDEQNKVIDQDSHVTDTEDAMQVGKKQQQKKNKQKKTNKQTKNSLTTSIVTTIDRTKEIKW